MEIVMNVLDSMFGSHTADLQNALGRASKRQSMLMTNLANVNVPGYKRKDLDFHVMLHSEYGNTELQQQVLDSIAQERSDQTSLRLDGNNVDLEKEVMSITETEMHYQAVADLTAGYFSGLKNVIREGK